jgi:hypothetical protein
VSETGKEKEREREKERKRGREREAEEDKEKQKERERERNLHSRTLLATWVPIKSHHFFYGRHLPSKTNPAKMSGRFRHFISHNPTHKNPPPNP